MTNRNKKGAEANRPQNRMQGGLTSTPGQQPSWEKRGGWGKVTMISHGVEISPEVQERQFMAISWSVFFSFFFFKSIIHC